MPIHSPQQLTRAAVAVAAGLALGLAGCADASDDDASSATDAPDTEAPDEVDPTDPIATEVVDTEPPATDAPATDPPATDAPADAVSGDDPPVCSQYFAVSAALAGEPDPATIGPLLDAVDADAPTEIAEPLGTMTGGARTVLETGDFTVFETPEFGEAVSTVDGWMFDNCAFAATNDVSLTEYAFAPTAPSYPAGRNAWTLTNDGQEAHELLILRKNDGVELSVDELRQLPESDAETMVTYVGGAFVATPGETGVLIADLEPGNYIAVCDIPAGTTVGEDGSFTEGTGQTHAELGMQFEFTVG